MLIVVHTRTDLVKPLGVQVVAVLNDLQVALGFASEDLVGDLPPLAHGLLAGLGRGFAGRVCSQLLCFSRFTGLLIWWYVIPLGPFRSLLAAVYGSNAWREQLDMCA